LFCSRVAAAVDCRAKTGKDPVRGNVKNMGSRLKGKKERKRDIVSEYRVPKLVVYVLLALGLMGWMVYVWLGKS